MSEVYQPAWCDPGEREALRQSFIDDDWNPYVIDEPAGYTYLPHHHAEDKLIVVLEGVMAVTLGNETVHCRPGDRLTIPGGKTHAAVMGEQGCIYFWSEQVHPALK